MKEHVVVFGSGANLVGIYTEPAKPLIKAPAILLLNAGFVHRPGPFGLNTYLARELATIGFPVFRFDTSGIGDSGFNATSPSYTEQVIGDIEEAITHLQKFNQIDKFVLAGLCSGADNAHIAAVRLKQVIGAIFLDGYSYPTLKFYLRRYGPILLNPGRLWRIAKRSFGKLPGLHHLRSSEDETARIPAGDEVFYWYLPPKGNFISDLKHLIDRQVHLFYVYTGGSTNTFNYEKQFTDSLPDLNFNGLLHTQLMSAADHTFILPEDQRELSTSIKNWLKQLYEAKTANNS